jgi:hypothetical protein
MKEHELRVRNLLHQKFLVPCYRSFLLPLFCEKKLNRYHIQLLSAIGLFSMYRSAALLVRRLDAELWISETWLITWSCKKRCSNVVLVRGTSECLWVQDVRGLFWYFSCMVFHLKVWQQSWLFLLTGVMNTCIAVSERDRDHCWDRGIWWTYFLLEL